MSLILKIDAAAPKLLEYFGAAPIPDSSDVIQGGYAGQAAHSWNGTLTGGIVEPVTNTIFCAFS